MATASPYLRQEPASSHLWVLAAFGLVAFAAALGVALAYGEIAAFFVGISLVASLAVLFDYRIGAVLLLLMLPLSATQLFPYGLMGIPGLNPMNVLVMATLLAYLLQGGRLRQLAPAPVVWLLAVPIVVAGAMGVSHVEDIADIFVETGSLIVTGPVGYLQQFVLRPLLIIAVALLLAAAVTRSQRPERFLVPIMGAVWVMALIELVFIAVSGTRLGSLASASARDFYDDIGIHANELGRIFMVAYALLLFVWWETKKPGLKAALFITLGVTCIAMVLTFSRGALLGFFVANGVFLLWKFNAKTIGLALLAGALAVMIAPDYLWSRLTYGFDADMNAVSADRIEGIWLPLLPEIWKTPLWGHGLGFTMWSPPMLNGEMLPAGHPHNAYLEALLDVGVIGLALMLLFYWKVWRGFRMLGSNAFLSPEMRGLFQGGSAALICFVVTGVSGSSLRPEGEF
ncbi:MAG TPA: O-antigen ligase family protein, partial [Burkholderiales bacterium]